MAAKKKTAKRKVALARARVRGAKKAGEIGKRQSKEVYKRDVGKKATAHQRTMHKHGEESLHRNRMQTGMHLREVGKELKEAKAAQRKPTLVRTKRSKTSYNPAGKVIKAAKKRGYGKRKKR